MLNEIIKFSIKNKLIIGIFVLMLLAWGVYSLKKLPIDAVPDITNNQVQIITTSPSLAAQEIEQLISFPVEQTMSTIPEIQEIRSISRFGLSVVTVVFHDDADIYWARQQVSERLVEAKKTIPESAGSPEMAPISTGLGEIYQYTLHANGKAKEKLGPMELRTMQDWIVKRQLLGTPGIADVSSFGGFLKQYEIAINIDRLRSYNLSIAEVFTALSKNNQNTGGSYIDKRPNTYFIRSEGLLGGIKDIEKIIVKNTANKLPITIRDIATVQLGHANRYGAMTRNSDGEVVGGLVLMLKGANANEVIKNVKRRIEQIQKSLPEGVVIEPFLDRSEFVGRAIGTVEKNLIEGALIVIFVLVLFLGNVRSGLIVASVIPLAMLFAISLMNLFHVSGNLMSLGAIDFGLIVDGAVIIVEATMHHLGMRNINRQLTQDEMDDEVYDSASKIRSSAAFGEIIILIVYLPILALVGIEGKMFRPMAQTVSFAILGAFILSLTYVPMMCALFLNKNTAHKRNFSDKMMDAIHRFYEPVLKSALKFKKVIVIVAILLTLISGFIFSKLGGEFIPTLEEGDFAVETRLLTGSSLDETVDKSLRAADILRKKFPEVKEVIGKIGSGEIPTDPMPIEACDLMVILKDKKEWVSASNREELAGKMAKALEAIPGVTFGFQQPIQMRFNELMTGARQDIAIKIFGEDLDMLSNLAAQVGKIIPSVSGAEDLYVEQVSGLPQIVIKLNRDKISQYGLNIEDINNAVNTAFAGGVAGTIFEGEKRFDLVVRLEGGERKDIEDVKRLIVTSENGLQLPLEQVADVNYQLGPNQIQREDAKRRITIGFNVRGRDIATVVKEVQKKIDQKVKMPTGYYVTYGGQFKNLEEANQRLSVAVPIALALIVLLLYFTFGSFKYSILIFTAIPMSAIGGVFALLIRGMPFSISAGIGFIALFGVAVLNGIVLITEFNRLKSEGIDDLNEIVLKGTSVRLRPVLMTACVASLGFLPMALSHGAGAEVQKPLATVVIGGLVSATLLTLLVLPVLYTYFERFRTKKQKSVTIAVLIAFILTVTSSNSYSQQPGKKVDLQTALTSSLAVNPTIKVGNLDLKYQRAIRGTSFDIGKTNISATYGQYNSPIPYDNNFTITQSIPNPIYLRKLRDVANANVDGSQMQLKVYQGQIVYEVKTLYYRLLYRNEQRRLADSLTKLFENVLRAADIRFNAGETNILEKYNANSQLQEALLQRGQLDEQIKTDLFLLSQYMNDSAISGIYDTLLVEKPIDFIQDSGVFNNNPQLQVLRNQITIASKELQVERSKMLPDFSIGYFNQSLVGTYEKNGKSEYYSAKSRFQGMQAGISIPIFFKPQLARIKAADIGRQQKQAELNAFMFGLSQKGALLLLDMRRFAVQIEYYRKTALPQAELLIKTSRRAFEAGEMDYYQLSQSLNNANNIRKQFIEVLNQYNNTVIELELISGI